MQGLPSFTAMYGQFPIDFDLKNVGNGILQAFISKQFSGEHRVFLWLAPLVHKIIFHERTGHDASRMSQIRLSLQEWNTPETHVKKVLSFRPVL